MKKIVLFLIAAMSGLLLAGCGSSIPSVPVTDATQQAILAFSEAKTDNLVAGMNANDYAMFSKDFDQDMLNAMTQSQFETFKQDRDAKLGAFVSRKVNSVVQQGDFYVVIYDSVFEKDPNVTMRVVFRVAEPHPISGLWFNK